MPTAKRLLIITPGFLPLLGGMEEQCYLIGQEFTRQGWHVDILTERTKPDFLHQEVIDALTVYRIGQPGPRSLTTYLRLTKDLTRFLIAHRSEYHLIMIRTFTFPGLLTGFLKRIGLVPTPTFITADTGGEADELLRLQKSRFVPLMAWCFNGHTFLNSICHTNQEHMRTLGLNPRKYTYIYNGFDTSPYPKSTYPAKIRTFLFLGQILRTKGVFELIEAFDRLAQKHPEIQLHIAGDGHDLPALKNQASQTKSTKQIHFLGRISREEKATFFADGDCLVLPSYSEGFPLVVGEAAIFKRCIVATDVSDLKKVYGDQIFYCEIRDVTSLYEALEQAYLLEKPSTHLNYDQAMALLNSTTVVQKIANLVQ